MDSAQKEIGKIMRAMSSSDATDWLIDQCSFGGVLSGRAVKFIGLRSWQRSDQIRLANCFLTNLPHASDSVYKAFLSFMSLPLFLQCIEKNLPESTRDRELMGYYLAPLLKKYEHDEGASENVQRFLQLLN